MGALSSLQPATPWRLVQATDTATAPISELANLALLRTAIHSNRATFPSQAPRFTKQNRSEIQWRLAVLYFERNWSCEQLGRRYSLTQTRIRQLLSAWVNRAKALGYIQEIPPAGLVEPFTAIEPQATSPS